MKNKKILIVGGSAGGSTLATNLRRLDEDSEIIMIEKGPDVSFSNCSLPYYFSGEVEEIEDLIVTTPEKFKKIYNIDARVNEEVIKINRKEKSIEIKKLETDEVYKEDYDYLVLSPGGKPKAPKDLQGENAFVLRNVEDVRDISDYVEKNDVKKIAVVGNGYIGVEIAEAFKNGGKEVTIIGSRDQVLMPFDEDMAQIMHRELIDNGIKLVLGSRVKRRVDEGVELESGDVVEADLIILAIGISPETSLVEDAELEIGTTGGILVDANYKTKDDYIFAIGDAIEVHNALTRKPMLLALAGVAHRQADSVANYIYGEASENPGVIGSAILRVFDLNCAVVGLNERTLEKEEIKYKFVYNTFRDKAEGGKPVHMKLIFEDPTGQVLGAQIIGKGDVAKRIDTISTMIMMKGNLKNLWENELAYAPFYSTPKDMTNVLASTGINYLKGQFKKVPLRDVRKLVEEKAYILDARSEKQYEKGHIIGSTNIPTPELRDRLSELPKDEPIYTQSYSTIRLLEDNGYKNAYYIDGSFEDLCIFEYYKDVTFNREKIVSEYKFD